MKALKKVLTVILAVAMIFSVNYQTILPVSAQSIANNAVDYIDANGEKQIADNVNILTAGESTTLNSGWYMLRGTHSFEGSLTIIGNVHLILEDDSNWTIKNGGIRVCDNNSLTIYDQSTDTHRGKLTASGEYLCAGIGGNGRGSYLHFIKGGNITINGGVITAVSGYGGAGIGGGGGSNIIGSTGGSGGNITINGGIVTATGGPGAGIGGGHGTLNGGDGGNIIINGGIVYADSESGGAGIGGGSTNDASAGYGGCGGDITINGGTIIANGGEQADIHGGGAGIGGGAGGQSKSGATHTGGKGASVTITGGTISATGGYSAAGIGGASGASGGEVIIDGGSIEANGSGGAKQIGSGKGGAYSPIPKNSEGFDIYLNTYVAEGQVESSISSIRYGEKSYGAKDVYTDEYGKLYFYLPNSTESENIDVMIENVLWSANYKRVGSCIVGLPLTNVHHTIMVTADTDRGTVLGGGVYCDNARVSLTAEPKKGYTNYVFSGWYEDGELISTEPVLTFTANADRDLYAKFDVQQYKLEVSCNEGGTVTGSGTYYHNEYVICTATPDDGYAFDEWSSGNGQREYGLYIKGDTKLYAKFVKLYNITAVSGNGGTVSGGGSYRTGKYATLTAKPDTGYKLAGWYENGECLGITSNKINIKATSDRTIEARFVKIIDAAEPNITKQPTGCSTVEIGSTLNLSVDATSADSGTLTYQWYSNTHCYNFGGTIIEGATNYKYSVPTTMIGTKYYYCMITNTNNDATGEKTASICSDVVAVKVTGHSYTSRITKNATCTATGVMTYTCSCGDTYTEIIPALGHSYETVVTKATCTTDGYTMHICTTCGEQYKTDIVNAGHKYDSGTVLREATCKETGIKSYYCRICYDTYDEEIPKTPHKYDSGKVTKKATCKATGIKTYTCSLCGETKTETIAKTGHTYKNVVTKATLSKNGKIDNKCSVCGKVSKTTTVYYPKTIKLSKYSFTYNGKAQKPSVIVKESKGNTLKLNKDYTVSYSNANSKNVGKYTVTIKFKGNYSGTKTLGYHIYPKGTEFLASNKGGFKAISKGFTLKWNKQASQTTGYQIQYATKRDFSNAATVTIANPNTTSYTFKNRAGNTRYYVRIRTYKKIGNSTFYSSWNSGVKSVVTLR